jgi:hypothetical protein
MWRGTDIDFASHPGFSASYQLRGEDEGAIRRLFLQSILDAFQEHNHWCVESGHSWIAVYKCNETVCIRNLPLFYEQTARIFRLFISMA